ncbi:MAG: ATP-binding protein [Chloroflexi bacterium]|nr:ATP-binding protein [Chloroflexota bacterium]
MAYRAQAKRVWRRPWGICWWKTAVRCCLRRPSSWRAWLLRAKQEYELERELLCLDRLEVVILDDIGYVQQSRGRDGGVVHLLSERYERAQFADYPPTWSFFGGTRYSGRPIDDGGRHRPGGAS